jgi:hypothetical protein
MFKKNLIIKITYKVTVKKLIIFNIYIFIYIYQLINH